MIKATTADLLHDAKIEEIVERDYNCIVAFD